MEFLVLYADESFGIDIIFRKERSAILPLRRHPHYLINKFSNSYMAKSASFKEVSFGPSYEIISQKGEGKEKFDSWEGSYPQSAKM